MRGEQLSIQSTQGSHEGQRIVKLTGPLTLTTLFEFQKAVQTLKGNSVIIDLTGVPFIDSAGLGAMVNAHVSCVNGGHRLALVGITENVRKLLRITRMEKVFALFPTLSEAEATLDKQASA